MSDKIEIFNRVCDSLCKHSELNTGKPCELLNSTGCPLNDLMKPETEEKAESLMINAFAAIICTVHDIKASIPLANNSYVQTGYEVSLDILKTNLEKFGINASFVDEVGEEE